MLIEDYVPFYTFYKKVSKDVGLGIDSTTVRSSVPQTGAPERGVSLRLL